MATFEAKENVPSEGVTATQGAGIKRVPRKGSSGIPIAISRRTKAKSKPFQDVQSKVNSGANEDVFSKSLPKVAQVVCKSKHPEVHLTKEADFIPDPESLKEILKDKPMTSMRQNPRDSKYVIPHRLDNTPACVRLSVYRNRHGKTGDGHNTPTYSNHRGRINQLCERIAQSTAAICQRKYSIRDSTRLDDVKLDLNLELNKKGALTRSPSHPCISREYTRPDPIHRSPSMPELGYTLRNQLTEQFMMTPLRTHVSFHSSTLTPAQQLHPSLSRLYDIDNELVSIFRAAPKPCGLSRTDCPNPLAGQLHYDCP